METSNVSTFADSTAREPLDVKLVRNLLHHWPFCRGKGLVLRCFRSLRNGPWWFEVEPGVVLPLDLGDYVIRYAFTDGYAREPEVRLSRALIRRGDTVVDVGAHVGLWVMGAAIRAGREGRVHALEPVARTFEQLTENVKRNGLDFVRCHQSGCSSQGGRATIYAASNGNSGMSSLAPSAGVDVPQQTTVMTLDGFCAEASLTKVDFLKVDVEGAELHVFRGGRRLLSSFDAPAILFEVGASMAARFGSSCRQVKTLLRDYGYEVYILQRKKLEPVLALEEHVQVDLFALKPAHFQRHPWLGALVT